MENMERSVLWCEEEMEEKVSPSPSSASSSAWLSEDDCVYAHSGSTRCAGHGFFFSDKTEGEEEVDEEDEVSIACLLSRQAQFAPAQSYHGKLLSRPLLWHARSLAARWLVKAHSVFHFNPLTAALAVNYLDRYLERSLSLPWKSWMMELLSVACLSLAAKMEEVDVPALLDLQACDGLEHAFEGKTVQRMEMNVLSALNWRMSSTNAFSFAEKAINHFRLRHHLKNALMTRTSELLLATFQEAEFLEYEPCLVAVSSICFALEEILPVQADQLKLFLFQYIPIDTEKARSCYVQMESLIVDPVCTTSPSGSTKSPLSPNTVVLHIEENTSVGTTSYIATNDLFLERIASEEIVFYPKRQRIT